MRVKLPGLGRLLRAGAPGALAALIMAGMAGRHASADESAGRGTGVWDNVLETLNLKAKPADPAPDFVRKTRPSPGSLKYLQPTLPHKVSPLRVRSAGEVEAAKAALDAAQARQSQPAVPPPLELRKSPKPPTPPTPGGAD